MKHKPRCVLKIISSCRLHKNCQLSSFEQYSFQITPHNEVPYNTADKADAPPCHHHPNSTWRKRWGKAFSKWVFSVHSPIEVLLTQKKKVSKARVCLHRLNYKFIHSLKKCPVAPKYDLQSLEVTFNTLLLVYPRIK